MKQRLGRKKHARCEAIAQRTYWTCYTSAKYGHFIAECWFGKKDAHGCVQNADYVNYRAGTFVPKIREGRLV